MDTFEADIKGGGSQDTTIPSAETNEPLEKAGILECCKTTINMHAINNPMMVCSDCKQIIKCFDTELAFRNYRRFCTSRHRKIAFDRYRDWLVIVFKSYDTFST